MARQCAQGKSHEPAAGEKMPARWGRASQLLTEENPPAQVWKAGSYPQRKSPHPRNAWNVPTNNPAHRYRQGNGPAQP